MNKFNKPNRFGGGNRGGDRKSFGGGRSGGGFNGNRGGRGFGGPREMHDTVCAGCGDKCQVPFRPTGDKPVYCDNCFGKNNDRGNTRNDRGDRKDFGNKNSNYKPIVEGQNDNLKKQIETLNTKIDALTNLVQTMIVAKPATKEVAPKAVKKTVKKESTPEVKKVVTKKVAKAVVKNTSKTAKVVVKKTSKSKK